MRNIKLGKTLVASALGLAVLAGFTPTAGAADTTTTFSLTSGALSITAPASKALGSADITATSVAGVSLGTVSVNDARGGLLGTWTASVTSTDFTTGTATAAETIAKANATYWSGAATASSGTQVLTPGQALETAKVTLAASRTAFGASGVTGTATASWAPTIGFTIPSGAVAGTYTGTVTHSIA